MAADRFGESETPATGSTRSASEQGPATTGSGSGQDAKETAKEQTREVAHEGVKAGEHVAAVASDQAKEVASQAGQQARTLLQQARSELMDSLTIQQNRVADQLHGLSQELGTMASRSDQKGLGANLTSQASRQIGGVAHWISVREPGSMVQELKEVASRKPGTFLAVAAGIGLVAGRMTRGATAGAPQPPSHQDASAHRAADGHTGERARERQPEPLGEDFERPLGEQFEQAGGEQFLPPRTGGTL
jgi:hypothetical protein